MTDLKAEVRERYGRRARDVQTKNSCCGGTTCCGGTSIGADNYDASDLASLPDTVALASAGCGNPTMLASIRKGDVVLDLGSGGGIDVFLSAQRVGPRGHVYGLDMTPEMLTLARENAIEGGFGNTEFLEGDIEQIPLPDCSVDVIISNCVINLAPEKRKVFGEAYRVLKPGGRFAVSDIMFDGEKSKLPEEFLASVEAWASCVSGALEVERFKAGLLDAGFEDVSIQVTTRYDLDSLTNCCGGDSATSPSCGCGSPPDSGVAIVSGFARATKPSTVDPEVAIKIEPAVTEDLGDILGILAQYDLPIEGVAAHLQHSLVAKQGRRVIGVCGAELYGSVALVRSVAVTRSLIGKGVGRQLVETILPQLISLGVKEAYLLTTTAVDFFSALGFEQVNRVEVHASIKSTSEFMDLCPISSTVMRKRLS